MMLSNELRIQQAKRVTFLGIFWNLFLAVIKFIAGILGNSSAIVADAVHSLSDFSTDFAVLIGFRLANRPTDSDHHYGHGKFETLAAIVISIILFLISAGILLNALDSIIKAINGVELRKPGYIALGAAALSIGIKEWMYRFTLRAGKRINSQAIIANAWHHRSDSLSSVAALLGIGFAILLNQSWRVLDPVAAVIVSLLIFRIAAKTFKNGLNELLEASLSEEDNKRILKLANSIRGALYPHALKTRRIGNYIAIDMHVKVDKNLTIVEAHDIATSIENKIKAAYGKETVTSIHIEPMDVSPKTTAAQKKTKKSL